jgi:hypothetical protein
MRIKYKASPDDLVAFAQFHYRHYSPARRKNIILGILVPITFFILFWFDDLRKGRWDTLAVGAAVAAVIMLWLLVGQKRRLEKAVRKTLSGSSNKVSFGEHELEMTETGLIERREYEDGRFTWDVIERIGFTPDYTFIFAGAARGISIAKSSVLEGDYEEFGRELRQRFEEKLRTENVQQKHDLGKKVITDTAKIYKGDASLGKHSGRGIASFVIAITVGVLYLSVLGLMVILAAIAPELTQGRPAMLHIFTAMMLVGVFANVVGVVLGISGVCQKNRKKLFAVLGLVLNSTAVIGLGILMAIPKAIS